MRSNKNKSVKRSSGPLVEPVEKRLLMSYTGSLDTTFATGGKLTIAAPTGAQTSTVAVQVDDRTLVAGVYRVSSTQSVTRISRYQRDGTADLSFAGGSYVTINTTATKLIEQNDGKILVAGNVLERLNQDGSLDTSFGGGTGVVSIAAPLAGLVYDNSTGAIYTAAADNSGNPTVTEYNADGTVHTAYGTNGTIALHITGGGAATYTISALSMDGSGRVLVAMAINGNTALATFAVARITTSGTPDGTFGVAGVAEIKGSALPSTSGGITVANTGTIYQVGNYNYGQPGGSGHLITYGTNGHVASMSPALETFGSDVAVGSDDKPTIVGTAVFAGNTVIQVNRFLPVDPSTTTYTPDVQFNGTGVDYVNYNAPAAGDSTSVGDLGWSLRILGNGNIEIGGTSVNPAGTATSFNVTRLLGDPAIAAGVGTVNGYTFFDENNSGTLTTGEPTFAGYGAFIDANNNGAYDVGDVRVFTDANGKYTFSDLTPGTYHIVQIVGTGVSHSTPTNGKYTVTVAAGQTIRNENFGLTGTGSISGVVYSDTNDNGVQNTGEPGLNGFGAYIDFGDTGSFQAGDIRVYTNNSGVYTFSGLIPGTYYIRQNTPAHYRLTQPLAFPYTVVLAAGQAATGYNIGNEPI